MSTITTDAASVIVEVPNLLDRLTYASLVLAEIRDSVTGSERNRLSAKIEGIDACRSVIGALGQMEDATTLVDVLAAIAHVNPGTRKVGQPLTAQEWGRAKGCDLATEYATYPRGRR